MYNLKCFLNKKYFIRREKLRTSYTHIKTKLLTRSMVEKILVITIMEAHEDRTNDHRTNEARS